ncbi:MAG: uracil-DNA glycosylase, partial [Clostridia bacterium]|nr:uracil-DNA glycosylase [Clostridia bacterium]
MPHSGAADFQPGQLAAAGRHQHLQGVHRYVQTINTEGAARMRVSWQSLYDEIYACEKCELCRQIHNKVPGQGDIHAKLMFIGEGPGADEDMQGLAFVGAAGQLLTKMIAAMGYDREQVYICNIVKCRPPRNRTPEP